MMRMSTPCSSRCVAKLCRNVWTVTILSKPAVSAARRQARCRERTVMGRAGSGPGNREQEVLRTGAPPIGAENAEQLLGQHDIAILPTLAAADVDHHPGTVDVLMVSATASDTRRPAA